MSTSVPATPEPERKKGPWAHRQLISEIEHTPEYEEFMQRLASYHEQRGTTLTREPELGRKLLDLRKLYQTVTETGGYDKVTAEKGAWRDIALTYKPPVYNSNAGYILKTIYYKNLAAFEITNFLHKDPPPKEWLEDRSAAGGPIMTRTPEDFMAQSPKPEANGESASPPPISEKRSLREKPTPRNFFTPDTAPQRNNPPRSSSQHQQPQNPPQYLQHQQQHGHHVPGVINGANGNAGDAHFPHFTVPTSVLPHLQLVHTPRITPGLFAGTKRKHPEINGSSHVSAIGAGHTGIGLMSRVVMSLRCGIPEEVNFALTQLVRISFELGDDLRSEYWTGLGTALFERLQSVVQLVAEHTQDDMVYHAEFATQLEKTYEAALVLRNMALLNENAIHFAAIPNTKAILTDVLRLPNMPALAELKTYALDMIDVMAMHIHYPPDDPLIDVITKGLESPDRGILMGSLRVLCRFTVGRDDFNPIGDIPFPMMQRITSLLMLEDDDLVSACLDFLYQYTSNDDNVQNLLRPSEGYALIRHLVRLMIYQGITGEQLVYIKAMKKNRPPVHDIPHLPQEIVKDLLTYSEPERATKWMRCCFEEDPDADITQIALWQAYQARFNEYVGQGFPLLPAAEFIKNVSVAFQNASAMVLPTPQGQKFIIKGIRARETPMNIKGHVYLACKWFQVPGNAVSRCTAQLATPQDLWAHILDTHLPPPAEGHQQPLSCNWAGCSRFSRPEANRQRVALHVRTHLPDRGLGGPFSREEQEVMEDPDARVIIQRCETTKDERGEAAGIPFSSALVLRNIKQRGGAEARELIGSVKNELYEIMTLNKPLAPYVFDLVSDA